MKKCSKCNLEYPLSHYYEDPRFKDGRVNHCSKCRLEASNSWREKNRDRVRKQGVLRYANRTPEQVARKQDYDRKRAVARHNITIDQYNEILERQGNCCAICKSSEPNGRGTWNIDHDHKCCESKFSCGKCIRGLLCHGCNVSLGAFNDDINLLIKAKEYLESR